MIHDVSGICAATRAPAKRSSVLARLLVRSIDRVGIVDWRRRFGRDVRDRPRNVRLGMLGEHTPEYSE